VFYRADPWLHVIAGCMSSGKTDALFRLMRRAEYARRRILLVRPDMDTRTPPEYAESRSLARYPSRTVPTDDPWRIVQMARESDADLVGIPLRVTFGEKNYEAGCAEIRDRKTGETVRIPLAALANEAIALVERKKEECAP